MPENQLLEAKRSFHVTDEVAEHELAKDVSALANSLTGGILVYGLATKSTAGSDIVTAVHPMPASGQLRKVLSVVNRRIFPPIEQLEVFFAPDSPQPSNSFLLVISVPPQPRELLPFLVTGQQMKGKVRSNYLAIFHRRGEDVFASSPASIHAALSAGFGLLRGPAANTNSSHSRLSG